jgi:hypothetical protein
MTDRLSELPAEAVLAFRAESAGTSSCPRPGCDPARSGRGTGSWA